MRLAASFIFNAIRGAHVAMTDAGHGAGSHLLLAGPMVHLNASELRSVVGGDDAGLPKGGWKALALTTA